MKEVGEKPTPPAMRRMKQIGEASGRRTVASAFSGRANAIGMLRLAFAASVLASHSWTLGGFGREPLQNGSMSLGSIAVCGFFALSGLLITRSASQLRGLRYVWHRFLRIMPGYWVALVVVAFVFAPLAFAHQGRGAFLSAPEGPFQYLSHNALVYQRLFGVSGTPAHVPFHPGQAVWNGSLYTLWPEVECYVVIGVLAATGLLVRCKWIVPVGALLAGVGLLLHAERHVHPSWLLLDTTLRFGFCFFVGSSIWLYRNRIPLSASFALPALALVAVLLFTDHWDLGAGALFTYVTIWAATVIPFRKVGVRRDISYGLYIYAFPVQQALALADVQRAGVAVFVMASVAGAVPIALLSWYGVEKPALRLKDWSPRDGRRLAGRSAAHRG